MLDIMRMKQKFETIAYDLKNGNVNLAKNLANAMAGELEVIINQVR